MLELAHPEEEGKRDVQALNSKPYIKTPNTLNPEHLIPKHSARSCGARAGMKAWTRRQS